MYSNRFEPWIVPPWTYWPNFYHQTGRGRAILPTPNLQPNANWNHPAKFYNHGFRQQGKMRHHPYCKKRPPEGAGNGCYELRGSFREGGRAPVLQNVNNTWFSKSCSENASRPVRKTNNIKSNNKRLYTDRKKCYKEIDLIGNKLEKSIQGKNFNDKSICLMKSDSKTNSSGCKDANQKLPETLNLHSDEEDSQKIDLIQNANLEEDDCKIMEEIITLELKDSKEKLNKFKQSLKNKTGSLHKEVSKDDDTYVHQVDNIPVLDKTKSNEDQVSASVKETESSIKYITEKLEQNAEVCFSDSNEHFVTVGGGSSSDTVFETKDFDKEQAKSNEDLDYCEQFVTINEVIIDDYCGDVTESPELEKEPLKTSKDNSDESADTVECDHLTNTEQSSDLSQEQIAETKELDSSENIIEIDEVVLVDSAEELMDVISVDREQLEQVKEVLCEFSEDKENSHRKFPILNEICLIDMEPGDQETKPQSLDNFSDTDDSSSLPHSSLELENKLSDINIASKWECASTVSSESCTKLTYFDDTEVGINTEVTGESLEKSVQLINDCDSDDEFMTLGYLRSITKKQSPKVQNNTNHDSDDEDDFICCTSGLLKRKMESLEEIDVVNTDSSDLEELPFGFHRRVEETPAERLEDLKFDIFQEMIDKLTYSVKIDDLVKELESPQIKEDEDMLVLGDELNFDLKLLVTESSVISEKPKLRTILKLQEAEKRCQDSEICSWDMWQKLRLIKNWDTSQFEEVFWKIATCSSDQPLEFFQNIITDYSWKPSLKLLIEVLASVGVDFSLFPDHKLLTTCGIFLITYDEGTSDKVINVLKGLSTVLRYSVYSESELSTLAVILLWMGQDMFLQSQIHHLKKCISLVLDNMSAETWSDQVSYLADQLVRMTESSSTLLYLMSLVGDAEQGESLQQVLSYLKLQLLLGETDCDIPFIVTPPMILNLLQNSQYRRILLQDYEKLYFWLKLIDNCISTEVDETYRETVEEIIKFMVSFKAEAALRENMTCMIRTQVRSLLDALIARFRVLVNTFPKTRFFRLKS